MCGVFRGGRMPSRKIPPAPRTRRNAPGAKAGCAFFAPGFFAQAKKGGSSRHGAKALALDQAIAGREKSKSSSHRSHPHTIGREHVLNPVTNAHIVCSHMLVKNN